MATVDPNVGPQMKAVLSKYGLGSLATWVSSRITAGIGFEQIMLELYDTPEFKAAYPEIEARRLAAQQKGIALTPISVDDVLSYRTQAAAIMRSYGLPPSFYSNNSAFYDLIVNDVSLDELNWRVDNAVQRVYQAPPEVRQAFTQYFGAASDTALFSIFVDETKAVPALENMIQMAEAGGAAFRMGFELTTADASRLEKTNLGYNQFLEGFTVLNATRSLYDESIFEEGIDMEAEDEGISAAFGLDATSAQRVQQRAATRTASTQGKGGGLVTEQGAVGLGGSGAR